MASKVVTPMEPKGLAQNEKAQYEDGNQLRNSSKTGAGNLGFFVDGPFLIDCSGGWDMGHLILKASNSHLPLQTDWPWVELKKKKNKIFWEYELLDSGVALRNGIFHDLVF